MDWINVVIMAIGLAMDCCAVSTVQGLTQGKWHPRALLMALIFGCFHMGMPIIGYYAGTFFVNFMQTYAHWIALALLGFLGVKMIWESYHKDELNYKSFLPLYQFLLDTNAYELHPLYSFCNLKFF